MYTELTCRTSDMDVLISHGFTLCLATRSHAVMMNPDRIDLSELPNTVPYHGRSDDDGDYFLIACDGKTMARVYTDRPRADVNTEAGAAVPVYRTGPDYERLEQAVTYWRVLAAAESLMTEPEIESVSQCGDATGESHVKTIDGVPWNKLVTPVWVIWGHRPGKPPDACYYIPDPTKPVKVYQSKAAAHDAVAAGLLLKAQLIASLGRQP